MYYHFYTFSEKAGIAYNKNMIMAKRGHLTCSLPVRRVCIYTGKDITVANLRPYQKPITIMYLYYELK